MKQDEYIGASEVAEILKCSKSFAYKKMQQIRKELEAQNLITIHGRVPRGYLLKRFGLI
jgi:hypothetical protein